MIQLICSRRKCSLSECNKRKEQKIFHGRERDFWSWWFWFDFSELSDHKSIGSWPLLDLVHLEHLCSIYSLYHIVCDLWLYCISVYAASRVKVGTVKVGIWIGQLTFWAWVPIANVTGRSVLLSRKKLCILSSPSFFILLMNIRE